MKAPQPAAAPAGNTSTLTAAGPEAPRPPGGSGSCSRSRDGTAWPMAGSRGSLGEEPPGGTRLTAPPNQAQVPHPPLRPGSQPVPAAVQPPLGKTAFPPRGFPRPPTLTPRPGTQQGGTTLLWFSPPPTGICHAVLSALGKHLLSGAHRAGRHAPGSGARAAGRQAGGRERNTRFPTLGHAGDTPGRALPSCPPAAGAGTPPTPPARGEAAPRLGLPAEHWSLAGTTSNKVPSCGQAPEPERRTQRDGRDPVCAASPTAVSRRGGRPALGTVSPEAERRHRSEGEGGGRRRCAQSSGLHSPVHSSAQSVLRVTDSS